MNARERKTARGIAWSIGRALFQVLVSIGVGVTLARLLTPTEFGIMIIAMGFGYLAEALAVSGIAAAVVQRPALRTTDIHTALTLTALLGLTLGGALWILSSTAAQWYGHDDLTGVLRIVAITQIIALAGAVPRALLRRHLRFRVLALIDLFSYLSGYALISITLALLGAGVWSLAWGMLVWQTIIAVWCWRLAGNRHWRLGWDKSSAHAMISFGSAVSGKSLVVYGGAMLDSIWLGKLVNAATLGIYHRAYQLALLPLQRLGAVIGQVMFPAYALIQDHPAKLRQAFLEAQHTIAIICYPVIVTLIVVPEAIILGLYGEAWDAAAPILRLLALVALLDAAHHLAGALIEAKGLAARELRIQLIQVGLAFGAITLTAPLGLEAVAWARIAVATVLLILMLRLALPLAHTSWREWASTQIPGLIFALAIAALAATINELLLITASPDSLRLIAIALACAVAYVAGLWFIPGPHQRWRPVKSA